MSEKIAVVADMKAKPGKAAELKAELLKLIEPSRKDAGCISYDLHQDINDECLFKFYEQWESSALLDAHLAEPHLEAFKKAAETLMDGGLEVSVLKKLS